MSISKTEILFYWALLMSLLACQAKPVHLDYCQMIQDDQSYVNQDKSDMEKFESDKAKRAVLFAKNFDMLMAKTVADGFPRIHENGVTDDSCMKRAVQATMIHTAQSDPELFFGSYVATLFNKEIGKGNLDREVLRRSSIITARTIDLCKSLKPQIEIALRLWSLDPSIFQSARFVDCN